MMGVMEAFSTSYAQSRVKFLEAAATAGLQIESFNVANPSQPDEVHALDMAFQAGKIATVANKPKTQKLLVVNSANSRGNCYAGAGVQTFLLHDAEWMTRAHEAGVSVLYTHGFEAPISDLVSKYIAKADMVQWLDFVDSKKHQAFIFEALAQGGAANKLTFTDIKTIASTEPAWQGQTISRARQALFKVVDELAGV